MNLVVALLIVRSFVQCALFSLLNNRVDCSYNPCVLLVYSTYCLDPSVDSYLTNQSASAPLRMFACHAAFIRKKSSLFIHQRSGENPKDHGTVPPGYSNGVDLETRIGIYRENESEHMCMTSCM